MLDRLRTLARPLEDLPELVGDARLVLLGEATHGTHEFYAVRARLTRHLVVERGFRGVALEADWPATARVNDYVQGVSDEADARAALDDFAARFPVWMWRNEVFLELVRDLRGTGTGVYGLDLYGLRASMAQVVEYLDSVDPEAAARARSRYACFDALD
ncbi:MAG: erythromycin esterase family protein, partial [Actinomycetota bacterium]|nr:erythromycin esterase family protein [Actinomycetota bacterium]